MFTNVEMNVVFQQYLETALWSTTDDEGYPLDHEYGVGDITAESAISLIPDVHDFLTANYDDLKGLDLEQIGHDFWLSRNGHGAGFFDRGLGDRGDRLQAAAQVYGEVNLYVNEGRVWA